MLSVEERNIEGEKHILLFSSFVSCMFAALEIKNGLMHARCIIRALFTSLAILISDKAGIMQMVGLETASAVGKR